MADETWDGIFVRGSLGEDGTLPRNSSSGSPDLIPYGTTPLEDPSILNTQDTYGDDFSNNIYLERYNYVYMRGKNQHKGSVNGHWELWAVPSNLILLPGLWRHDEDTVRLKTSDGKESPPFSAENPDEIISSGNAFTWKVDPLPGNRHYCLIGIAVSDINPNPIADTDRISDWGAILAKNGNIAQRNTRLITGDVPDMSDQLPYSQGSETSQVDLTFIFQNIPKGSTFHAASGTELPGYGTISLDLGDTQEFNFKHGIPALDIPANWATNFNWTLNFGDDWGDISGKPKVTLRGEVPMTSDHKYYSLGRIADPHPRTGEQRLDHVGNPIRIMTVGSFQTIAIDKINPNN
ncbi:hypothetical protein ACMDCT_04450 [Halomonadaceae bacterium KBTZ08]